MNSIKAKIEYKWNAIASYMDDEKREAVHSEYAPCSMTKFLAEYLKLDPDFADLLESEFDIETDDIEEIVGDDYEDVTVYHVEECGKTKAGGYDGSSQEICNTFDIEWARKKAEYVFWRLTKSEKAKREIAIHSYRVKRVGDPEECLDAYLESHGWYPDSGTYEVVTAVNLTKDLCDAASVLYSHLDMDGTDNDNIIANILADRLTDRLTEVRDFNGRTALLYANHYEKKMAAVYVDDPVILDPEDTMELYKINQGMTKQDIYTISEKDQLVILDYLEFGGVLNNVDGLYIMDEGELEDSFSEREQIDEEFGRYRTVNEWARFITRHALEEANASDKLIAKCFEGWD